MRHPVLRYGAAALCVLGVVYFLLPLSIGVLHIGMLYPVSYTHLTLPTICSV